MPRACVKRKSTPKAPAGPIRRGARGAAQRITILLVDDHALMRDGLRVVLEHGGHRVVGESDDPTIALADIQRLTPGVLLLDLNLGKRSGLELLEQLPRRKLATRTIVLTMSAQPHHVAEAMRLGAHGYVLKGSPATEVVQAVEAVAAGRKHLGTHVAGLAVEGLTQAGEGASIGALSARERQVILLVVRGQTSVAIGEQLHLSPKTVESYRSRLMAKLGVSDLPALVRLAIREGCDHIKLDVSGDPFYPNTPGNTTPMTFDEIRVAAETAEKLADGQLDHPPPLGFQLAGAEMDLPFRTTKPGQTVGDGGISHDLGPLVSVNSGNSSNRAAAVRAMRCTSPGAKPCGNSPPSNHNPSSRAFSAIAASRGGKAQTGRAAINPSSASRNARCTRRASTLLAGPGGPIRPPQSNCGDATQSSTPPYIFSALTLRRNGGGKPL